MRKINTVEELIKGIEEGERQFKTSSRDLLRDCKQASEFDYNSGFDLDNLSKPKEVELEMERKICVFGAITGYDLGLAGILTVGAIAIIAILKNKHLKIKVDGRGEVEVY